MAIRRGHEGALAMTAAFALSIAWAHGCGIDLSDELAGRPCKNRACLPGYVCSEANTCVLDPGSGGALGSGGSNPEGGTQGVGGSTEGTGGAEGTGPDPDASSGGTGASGGNDGTGGTAASDGSAESGGTGGIAGSGGTGDAADSGGSDAGLNRWPGVGCHQLSCGPAEICCVRPFPGFMTLAPATAFSCMPPNSPCDFTFQCDGDHDCPAGEHCCVTQTAGGWVAGCTATCPAVGIRVECTLPAHCRTGLLCCGDWNFALNRFASVLCGTSCNGLSDRVLCNAETDCGSSLNCLQSAALPGFKTCQ